MTSAFDPSSVEDLPPVVPIFPLSGATLLPHTSLPLNVFEPRYLNMVFDALASHRYIAMVQPSERGASENGPAVYEVGCAGRITAFNETDDGRLLISLKGICRYRIMDELELEPERGYRRVHVDWAPFAADLVDGDTFKLDRAQFRTTMAEYFDQCGLRVDWEGLDRMRDDRMIDFLAMSLPFSPQEKQALLEAPDSPSRHEALVAVARMARAAPSDQAPGTRH